MSTPAIRLSICIATLNRAAFIGETLESMISQATGDVEIVIVDSIGGGLYCSDNFIKLPLDCSPKSSLIYSW